MQRPVRPLLLFCTALCAGAIAAAQPARTLPLKPGSVRFAVIGDSGRGSTEQLEVARRMAEARALFPFEFVIMLGDNIYESAGPGDYAVKFERPYAPLLEAGVKFYAAIGNHDPPNQEHYGLFNMDGERYYTFKKGDVRFFVLDSTSLDPGQLRWLRERLARSASRWKIVYMHHPIYTPGRYGRTAAALRMALEPIFVRHGVNAVFAGHEHFYYRSTPQHGITHFLSGGAGSLRRGDIRPNRRTAAGFDDDYHFMLVEIARDELWFEAVSRTGKIVDSGVLRRPPR